MLVNLNNRIGVRINFDQSQIPALVCSLQSEHSCRQVCSQVATGATSPPIPKLSS